MRTAADAFRHAIETWEGGFQAMEADSGNWVTHPDGTRALVGTNRGVTPGALARHRGVQPHQITRDMMQALTVDEAVAIGMEHYYRAPGWGQMPFSPAVEVWVDIGWGSGPVTAIRHMQAMIGARVDGEIGPATLAAWSKWIQRGAAQAVREIHAWRTAFYADLVERRPANAVFLAGWLNRANHYQPGTPWWQLWQAPPPEGYVRDDSGNVKRDDVEKKSRTIAEAGKGQRETIVAGAAAGTGLIAALKGLDWYVALPISLALAAAGGLIIWRFVNIKRLRREDNDLGVR